MTSTPEKALERLVPSSLRLLLLFLCICQLNACKAQESPESPQVTPPLKKPTPIKRVKVELTDSNPIYVSYPQGGTTAITASSSFIIGSVLPGGSLSINGKPVSLNKDGFFAQTVPLTRGVNRFQLLYTRDGAQTPYSAFVQLVREKLREPLSPSSLVISGEGVEPADDRALTAGDIIEFSCHATPGAAVYVELAGKKIEMASLANLRARAKERTGPGINRGLEAAYGQIFQRFPQHSPDLYLGLYRIENGDFFTNCHPRFVLTKGGKNTSLTLGTNISVVKQPLMAHTIHDDTIVRVAPELARLTPLPAGVRLITDGYQKDNIRCLYKTGKHVWIKREDLQFEPPGAPAPRAVCRSVQVEKDDWGEIVSIPMSQRLPFLIEQTVSAGSNKLQVKIYGAQSDTDWVYQSPADGEARLIEDVSWKQPDDSVYEIDIALKPGRQWGYFAEYKENNLNLHIKYPPRLVNTAEKGRSERPLEGLVICVDPGHGGLESGAIGPSGLCEAEVNLAIAKKFKTALEKEGATVFMTREEDIDVSLNDRVVFARDKKVDLLISVHNNALPDGRDPLKEHGTSTYRYHPQSIELARCLKDSMVKELELPDLGARYQNLALCRPTAMQAVLVEVAFMVNPDEYSNLINSQWQNKAARSLVNGLLSYFARK